MARCDKGWSFCKDCINSEGDPEVCEDCDDGDNYEGFDDTEELTVHDLKFIRFKEAA
jgi:hypothetical protein